MVMYMLVNASYEDIDASFGLHSVLSQLCRATQFTALSLLPFGQ